MTAGKKAGHAVASAPADTTGKHRTYKGHIANRKRYTGGGIKGPRQKAGGIGICGHWEGTCELCRRYSIATIRFHKPSGLNMVICQKCTRKLKGLTSYYRTAPWVQGLNRLRLKQWNDEDGDAESAEV